MNRAGTHLAAIDALRLACAVAVMAYHVGTVFPLAESSATRILGVAALPAGAAAWTASGWIGVEIFFVISGFVIAGSVSGGDRAAFLRARVLRLLPAALVCATITGVVLAVSGAVPVREVVARWAMSVTMLPFGARIDGVWWTLQVEVSFYLLVALTMRRIGVEAVGWGLALWSGAYWLAAVASGRVVDGMATPLMLVLMPHGALFALGIAIRGLGQQVTFVRIAAVALALAVSLVEVVARGVAADGAGGVSAPVAVPVALFLGGVAMIAGARWLQPGARGAAAMAAMAAMAAAGRATYPLYLVNQVVGAATIVVLMRLGVPAAPAMTLGALAMLALAGGIAARAEPALRGWLAARISPRRGPAPDSLRSASLRAG